MADAYEMLFRHITEHVPLTDTDKELIRSCYKLVHYRKRQYVQKEGEIVRISNFVVKGCLRSYYRDENGFAHVLMFAVENWWISDLDSYVYQTPSQLFIDALEDTDVLQVCREDQEMLYEKIPVLERYNRLIMARSLANIQHRIIGNLSKPAAERYLFFRQKYGFLEGRLPQHQIASYLGVTPEFLSNIRKKLFKKT